MFEPGPFAPDELPLGPRIVQPGHFAQLAADFPYIGSTVDQALATHAQTLAPYIDRDIDPSFNQELANAVSALDGLGLAGDDAQLGAIHAAIDNVVGDVQNQAIDLPGPDEPDPSTVPTPNDPDPGDLTSGPTVPTQPGYPPVTQPSPQPGPEPPPQASPQPSPEPSPPPGPGPALPPIYSAARIAVRALYLELLWREPDPGGWDNWTDHIELRGGTIDQVRAAILNSPEYRLLHGG